MPCRLLERNRGQTDALLLRRGAQRFTGAPTETRMIENRPDPRMRVQEIFHREPRNQVVGDTIGVLMSPRTSAVPARQPIRPPARSALAVIGTTFAISRSRFRITIVSPPAARRMSSLALLRNSPILTRFIGAILANILSHVKSHHSADRRKAARDLTFIPYPLVFVPNVPYIRPCGAAVTLAVGVTSMSSTKTAIVVLSDPRAGEVALGR